MDGTVRAEIDVERVSRLIISTLEGGMLLSRLEKNDRALCDAMEHLDMYLEEKIRLKRRKLSK